MAKNFKEQAKGVLDTANNPAMRFIDVPKEAEPVQSASPVPAQTDPPQPPPIRRAPMNRVEAKTRRVQLLIKPSVHAAIMELAAENGESFNEWANNALETTLKRQSKAKQRKG